MTKTRETLEIPLFPLHAVLFPGGALPLRIFEPRYLDMVGNCLKTDSGFGVCLISEGKETGEAAEIFQYGTLAIISYWQQLPDGLLGVTVQGQQRFQILDREVGKNQLSMARVALLENEPVIKLPARFEVLADVVREMLEEIGHPYTTLPKHYEQASWVGSRLAELLPISLVQKQYFLQLDDPLERLERLSAILDEMEQTEKD
ncbi:LON peptidase substrate-binding domain-containing protein [Sulfuriflexus sp.]|uniref:LON peptidase substrate-binding domain-containing protein n=1 Tax=Sulfuriflexus sp. TaxID=2015443 RepID=UPI0028CE3E51|nr:LON peptidase substrate-binding domain-containing protein [Sulfuriflexus sp.]MDT8404144.1 LON peptidase substrate-binding domain-containing protein [Sulfuriflexus sp.]